MSGTPPRRALLLFSLITGLTAVLALEVASRLVVAPPPYSRHPQVRYAAHATGRHVLRPCQREVFTLSAPVHVDCDGFRSNGAPSASAGALHLVALGDSFTFGLGVADRDTWPARLEEGLRARAVPDVQVLNAGTVAYGVSQQLAVLRELLERRPIDVLVHGLYWNDYQEPLDPQRMLTEDGHFVWLDERPGRGALPELARWLRGHSALVALADRLRARVGAASEASTESRYGQAYQRFLDRGLDPEQWRSIEAFYSALGQFQREHGFQLLSVVMPVVDLVDSATALSHPYRRDAIALLERLGIAHVDSFELWRHAERGRELFLPQGPDAHPNEGGYALIADALAERLLSGPVEPAMRLSGTE